ncbi:MAG: ABC transporter permease [Planctomycetes bacterium]|nr:ABC transporter permease [Planctomycetota bacterium]
MKRVMAFVAQYGIYVALAAEFLWFGLTLPGTFWSSGNLENVLRQNSFGAVLAVGMTLAILTGGIDLSIGSVVALAGVSAVSALAHGGGIVGALAAAVAVGAVVGLVNAVLVTRVRIPPFLASLAMMLIVRAVAMKVTRGETVRVPAEIDAAFSGMMTGRLPVAAMLAVVLAAWCLLVRTPFGRHVYAVGGNVEAARLAGIRVRRVLTGVYVLCGALAGLAGVMLASRLAAGDPRSGVSFELDAVAAVVVGGTSLFGGRGTMWGTLAGVFFVGFLNNGLTLAGVESFDQQIVKGCVLLAATSLDLWRGKESA